MMFSEQRKFKRSDARNLLAFSCENEQNGINTQREMGRTLNVSEGGILLETHIRLNLQDSISVAIALKEKTVDIKGKILWHKENSEGMFVSGIEFYKMDQGAFTILKQYIESFYKEPPL